MNLLQGAGIFIYPLGLCSLLAIFIILERWLSLMKYKVFPNEVYQSLNNLKAYTPNSSSVAGRIILFTSKNTPDISTLKAFARFEIAKMERGLFILDIIVAAAPLIGLLGTVVGLIQVFSNISPSTPVPDTSTFIQGISLALTTTMLGLLIAIPALAGNSYLNRRIEMFATKLDILIESLAHTPSK